MQYKIPNNGKGCLDLLEELARDVCDHTEDYNGSLKELNRLLITHNSQCNMGFTLGLANLYGIQKKFEEAYNIIDKNSNIKK